MSDGDVDEVTGRPAAVGERGRVLIVQQLAVVAVRHGTGALRWQADVGAGTESEPPGGCLDAIVRSFWKLRELVAEVVEVRVARDLDGDGESTGPELRVAGVSPRAFLEGVALWKLEEAFAPGRAAPARRARRAAQPTAVKILKVDPGG